MILEDVQALNVIIPTLHTVYCKLSVGSLGYLGILLQICKMTYTYKILIYYFFFFRKCFNNEIQKKKILSNSIPEGRLFETNHDYLYCPVNVTFEISNSSKVTDRNKKQPPNRQIFLGRQM